MKKLSFLFILILSAALLLAACGGNEKNDTDEVQKEGKQSGKNNELLTKIEKEGKLLVGTEGTYPPFTFHDENGKLTGFDVEIATEIGRAHV